MCVQKKPIYVLFLRRTAAGVRMTGSNVRADVLFRENITALNLCADDLKRKVYNIYLFIYILISKNGNYFRCYGIAVRL